MINKILSYFSHDIGMDLGTANVLIYVKGKGILIREPSVVAIHKKTKEVLAVGSEAKRMLGKTPMNINAIRPLRHGVISDFSAAEKMILYFIRLVHSIPSKFPKIPKPRIVIGVPSGVTSVERKAVIDAARNAGAREVFLIEEPMAAAIGAELPITEPRGTMIVDMGGGTCEIAIISLSGIVVNKSIRVAGDELDMDIVNYAKNKYNLLLGERSAEEIKLAVGNVVEIEDEEKYKYVMRGRDLKSGLPRSIEISPAEVRDALKNSIYMIIGSIKDAIEETPAELMSDIVRDGLVLAGGTSQLRGLDRLMSQELKIPVRVAKDPVTCVVRGCGKVLDDEALLHKVKIS
ncbi:rod shape-determining protein [candidate division WWE3 bacterium RIFOXYC1_FULL_39_7]|uniref:Cell shape-determining protein MreB n=2 Tax=Katanobacteria TaxID=422282 RepID=A0A1F4X7K4_UNCKA|nr:MAG: rod shape-determining protein [candidate division WWE3 bacterium RIFOXYC1_FULL_39_7]OGC77609.1 MAG: rod shape-determining protein [candidate division WWE3 bacterium RIFOXYD1_FULL_39_9]